MQTQCPSVDETLIAVDDTKERQGHPSDESAGRMQLLALQLRDAYLARQAETREPAPVPEAV